MTFKFMRIVDDSFGMFLCSILGIMLQIKHLFFPFKQNIDAEKVKYILLQKYFGMGSIIHAISLVKTLRRSYPKAKIVFLTTDTYKETVSICNIADEIITIRFNSIMFFIKDLIRVVSYLIRKKFDISIDLEFFAKFPMLISFLTLAPVRVGLYHRKIRPEGIITHKVFYNFHKHISEIYLAYASALNIDAKFNAEALLPSFKGVLEESIRKKFNLEGDMRIIAINVNAGDLFSFRKWPLHHFAELTKLLINKYSDYYYIFIGAKSEYAYVQKMLDMLDYTSKTIINCAGKTTLKELFALLEMSYLVITNDSGPLHIASLYNKNIAAFFGPESPITYGPINKNATIFHSDNLYCSPCMCVYDSKKSLYAETCENNICLSTIKPYYVFETIEKRFFN